MVISSEGYLYLYSIDLENGGECGLVKQYRCVVFSLRFLWVVGRFSFSGVLARSGHSLEGSVEDVSSYGIGGSNRIVRPFQLLINVVCSPYLPPGVPPFPVLLSIRTPWFLSVPSPFGLFRSANS